ncbi:hypothetical protein UFOVP359_62 [uncultured Caudovirales phage]|jgi:hypothetical protein|uniref:Major tail protein n=1 Tax=uncultured Caudovirales phage TaxID=2100421 RepID=A0A6J7X0D8_9CAUD|nr:hypothetical protein UFOVP359_62 [uncultured Caudovirales phage]
MSYSAKNIIVGAGVLYIGKTAGVEYDETEIAKSPNTLASDVNANTFTDPSKVDDTKWRHVGYTSEGAEMSFEPDYGEVQVDQLLDVAKIFKQGQRVMLNTTFTEATLENFLVAIGGKDGDKVSNTANGAQETVYLNGGALGYSPVERSVLVVGPGPDSKTAAGGVAAGKKVERLYIAYRALSMETVTLGVRRNEATVFPVSFRLLPSSDSANNAPDGNQTYGKVIDRVYGQV